MPITSVRCNGRFAFAEFRTTEETNNAMNLNGIVIVGQGSRHDHRPLELFVP